MYIVFIVIVIINLIFIVLSIIAHRQFVKRYSNGTWIDNDGNVLVIDTKKRKVSISFGISSDGDEYEFSEKQYNYFLWLVPFTNSYKIKTTEDLSISVDIVKGIATVYNKNKKVGKFAKNNLLLVD